MIDDVMLNSPACGKGRFQHLINKAIETLKQVQGDDISKKRHAEFISASHLDIKIS